MKKDIILAGVGGQGILSIAAIIGTAAINRGLFLKQAEVHGMSQRGGNVHSDLRISDKEIHSDLIPQGKADLIISIEPMESLRYLPMLSAQGWLITNTKPYVNIPDYPEEREIFSEIEKLPQHVAIDADGIAKDLGSKKVANMVILGAAIPFLGLELSELEQAVQSIFGSKGADMVRMNIEALKTGRDLTEKNIRESSTGGS